VTQWSLQGKHTGVLHGFPLNTSLHLAPTGKDVTVTGTSIDHIKVDSTKKRQIIKHWDYINSLGLLQQLGAIPVSGQDDNRRASANASVSLGTQLISAALAVLAVEGALLTFVLDKRTPSNWFYGTVGATFVLLFLSILVGSIYINHLKIMLFEGKWQVGSGRSLFRTQTILGFLGLVAFAISALTGGPPREDTTQKAMVDRISTLENGMARMGADVARVSGIGDELHKLSEKLF
jgi:hypothetical protein